MVIRKTTMKELDICMEIYDKARNYMIENNNTKQWVNGYPSRELIEEDIRQGISYLCITDQGEIGGVFRYTIGEDETYREIYQGAWLNDSIYGVVHRIAVNIHRQGVAAFCFDWCRKQCDTIRIDTHRDNIPMQNLLKKYGFSYCGIIYLLNKEERLAFQI